MPRLPSPLRALLGPAALLAGLAAACSPSGGPAGPPPELPVLLQLRDFHLVDQDGAPVDPGRLQGRIWVLDFVFTRCPSVCPSLTRALLEVVHAWRKESRVGFLSVSVDPEFDTPEVLRRYAGLYGPRPRNWLLATGEREAVRALVMDQVKVAMGERPGPDGDITHSTRFVLVDPELRVRGFFRALEPEGREALETALAALLQEVAGQEEAGTGPADLSGLPCPVEPGAGEERG